MNLESVRAFVAVAEEGQFRHAAARLGLTQQAVSKRIATLESSLDVTLFRRVPTGAVLTTHGESFLPHARAVLMAVRQAVASVRTAGEPLRVDVLRSHLASAEILREFHRTHQDAPLETVTLAKADAAVRALLDGEIDVAFAYLRSPVEERDPLLKSTPVHFEGLDVVVGAQHPLARTERLRPADLTPFTAWMPGIVSGSEWAEFYREFGEAFSVTMDSSGPNFGPESLLETIAASSSLITFVGHRTRLTWPEDESLHRIPLVDPAPLYPWSLIWHSHNRHPGLPDLVSYVRSGFEPPDRTSVWLPYK
ncbi:LysR family transcriptional regulator [Streptomyces sp. NPDC046862]|uniref:LysR family transcriptional regulator n=1 Tax=Streptomyces sp. NPDC046862 TaxID=3154603 RepID=UPI0034559061